MPADCLHPEKKRKNALTQPKPALLLRYRSKIPPQKTSGKKAALSQS